MKISIKALSACSLMYCSPSTSLLAMSFLCRSYAGKFMTY